MEETGIDFPTPPLPEGPAPSIETLGVRAGTRQGWPARSPSAEGATCEPPGGGVPAGPQGALAERREQPRLGSAEYWEQVRLWPVRTARRALLRALRRRVTALGLEALEEVRRSVVPLCLTAQVHSDPAGRSYTPAHPHAPQRRKKAGRC